MREKIDLLIKMQECDDQVTEREGEKSSLPKKLNALKMDVGDAEFALNEIEEELHQVVLKIKDKEMVIKQNKDKAKKYEEQLATIKNNKEYKALNGEISLILSQNSAYETEIIELMEQQNSLDENKVIAQKTLEEKQEELHKGEEVIAKEAAEVDKKIAAVKEIRTGYAMTLNKMQSSLFRQYKILIKNRSRKAVAYEDNGACSACGFRIRPQLLIDVDRSKKITYCENCSRFLFIDPKNRYDD